MITTGAGVLQPIKTYTAQVRVVASNPIPAQTTNLVSQATVTRAGALASVRMQLPTGATGTYTTINGTLAVSGGYATWKPKAALNVAAGVNLGANTAYRLIKFTDDTRRSWDIDRYTDGYNSTTWRYQGDAYASQPLLGADYICAVNAGDLATSSGWMITGVPTGTMLKGFIAGEVDNVWPGLYKQPGLTTLASGSAVCHTNGRAAPMQATAYTASSGARVLNGSTFAYSCFLVRRCPSNWAVPEPDAASQQAAATIVGNITEWVSRGAIDVPADTAAAKVRVVIPNYKLATSQQG